jgi:hypothetical protein
MGRALLLNPRGDKIYMWNCLGVFCETQYQMRVCEGFITALERIGGGASSPGLFDFPNQVVATQNHRAARHIEYTITK